MDPEVRILQRIGPEGGYVSGTWFKNCNVVDYDGVRHVFSHRAILTMVVVSSCNAGCKFCSNEITFTPSGSYLTWGARLERTKRFALGCGVKKIAYTGGEPTLNPQRLYELVSAMSPGFERSRLHTNGFGLFRTVATAAGERPLIDALGTVGLTGVSVSVAHFDPGLNHQIMVLPKSWAGMSEEDLRAVASRSSEAFTPRLSCVMTKEGVSSVEDLFAYLEWGRGLGFAKFIFRSCSEIPDGFKKDTAFTAYNDANLLPIDRLADRIQQVDGVELVYRQRKSDSKVDVFTWRGLTFDVDESSEELDPDVKIRRLNVMPNGVTYTSWIDPLATLFADDAEIARASAVREISIGARPVTA